MSGGFLGARDIVVNRSKTFLNAEYVSNREDITSIGIQIMYMSAGDNTALTNKAG